jgi:hypothetical protein
MLYFTVLGKRHRYLAKRGQLERFRPGDTVFVVSWDAGAVVMEDCDTGYYVRGLEGARGFVTDHDVEGVTDGRIGVAVGSA